LHNNNWDNNNYTKSNKATAINNHKNYNNYKETHMAYLELSIEERCSGEAAAAGCVALWWGENTGEKGVVAAEEGATEENEAA
jgi:hypothetical protein